MDPFHSRRFDFSKQEKHFNNIIMAAFHLGEPDPGLWSCACSLRDIACWDICNVIIYLLLPL